MHHSLPSSLPIMVMGGSHPRLPRCSIALCQLHLFEPFGTLHTCYVPAPAIRPHEDSVWKRVETSTHAPLSNTLNMSFHTLFRSIQVLGLYSASFHPMDSSSPPCHATRSAYALQLSLRWFARSLGLRETRVNSAVGAGCSCGS